jgi:hypothetical protein
VDPRDDDRGSRFRPDFPQVASGGDLRGAAHEGRPEPHDEIAEDVAAASSLACPDPTLSP